MKNIIRIFAISGIMATAVGAVAQNTNSAYFVDNYTYGYQLNPAFGNERNFISMPALGNLNIGVQGTLNLTNVVFNRNGRTVLFTNPEVSVAEVMNRINARNTLQSNIRENILSAGFKAFGGYNTISLGARANVSTVIPGSLFSLIKEGVSNDHYNIRRLGFSAIGYGEIALNHSREIKQVPGLRVGAAVKFLIGMASVQGKFKEAYLNLDENNWTGVTDADVYVNLGKFEYDFDRNKDTGKEYVSGFNMDGDGSIGPNGFGVAFDLGLNYSWQGFNFSAAILDLGFINFKDTKHATTNGRQVVNTDAFTFNANSDAENSFDNEWDRLKTDFEKLYQLQESDDHGNHSHTIGATLNFGIDYALPVYDKLHFGVLNSTRLAGPYTWTEVRFSANINPVKCFSAGINFGAGSYYGCAFGWLLNYSNPGFNIFAGMDVTRFKFAKQGVPLNSNLAFNFGINFPF